MTKKELIQKLTELGIEHDSSMSGKELQALLDSTLPPTPSSAIVDPSAEVYAELEPANEPEETTGESVDVIVRGKMYVRSYSKKAHGKEYKKLAEGFIAKPLNVKQNAFLIDSDKVKEVEVRYREKEDAHLPFEKQNPNLPIVDRRKRFSNKTEALRFSAVKKGTVIALGL